MIVVDYTAPISPDALRAAGVYGVCRYLAPIQANTEWKRITPAEYRALTAAGIKIFLNWEYDSHDWMGGAARGNAHGIEAVRQARTFGYPRGAVIIGSADFDVLRSHWDGGAKAYGAAFRDAVRAGGYRPAVYGPYDVLSWCRDELAYDAFWQAGLSTSWSHGMNAHRWPGAQLRQHVYRVIAGQQTDESEILTMPPFPVPGAVAADLREVGVPFIAKDASTNTYYVCNLLTSRPVPSEHVADVLYLAKQLNYPTGPVGVEWTDGGQTRLGWTEAAFGALQPTAGQGGSPAGAPTPEDVVTRAELAGALQAAAGFLRP